LYSTEQLSSHPYFKEILKQTDISTMLDPLTGVLSRGYIIRFIRYLIKEEVPFALGMMDLDNFKHVNDNYGHKVGDGILSEISESMRLLLGKDGFIGRFGGDEFLIVYMKSNLYDDVHDFYNKVYDSGKVLRRIIPVEDVDIFMTATVGSASFPLDATDYEGLFSKIDKTLYRGKSKGRNCYIIYVESKHSKLEISMLAKHSLYQTLRAATNSFDDKNAVFNIRLQRGFAPIAEDLRLHKIFYINKYDQLKDPVSGSVICETCRMNEYAVKGDIYAISLLYEIQDDLPEFYQTLRNLSYTATMISRITRNGVSYGYLAVCPEPSTQRMWQDDEYAAIFFLSHLAATYLEETHSELT
jgi:diguanylate cyclase (GGDEF)-like protein